MKAPYTRTPDAKLLTGLGATGRCKAFDERDAPCRRRAQPGMLICRKCEERADA